MATIITKNSSTASSVPLNTQLVQGELAVNVTDKRLFTENASGTVVELGTNPSSLTLPNGVANAVCYLNGSKVLTTGSALTFDGTVLTAFSGGTTVISSKATTSNTAFVSAVGNNGTVGATSFDMIQDGSGIAYLYQRANQPIIFGVNNSEQMRLTSTGLGIGTSLPGAKLHVNGAVIVDSYMDFRNAGSAKGNIYVDASNMYINTQGTNTVLNGNGGNLGLGVTPSAWTSSFFAIQCGTYGNSIYGWKNSYGSIVVGSNHYVNASGTPIYTQSQQAARYVQEIGGHRWETAPSGTAGNAITFTQAMTLDASSNLTVGGAVQLIDTNTSLSVNSSTKEFKLTNAWGAGFFTFSTNGSERARIDSSGNLLVQTGDSNLNSGVGHKFQPNATAPIIGTVGSDSSNSSLTYRLYSTGAAAYRFYVGYGGTVYATSTSISAISDATLKENVRDLETGLTEVMALRPRRFDWKNGDAQNVAGFVAQEVEQVLPELVTDYVYNKDEEGNDIIKKSLKMGDILPTLVKAIQEQQAIINAQSAALEQLKADVAALKAAA